MKLERLLRVSWLSGERIEAICRLQARNGHSRFRSTTLQRRPVFALLFSCALLLFSCATADVKGGEQLAAAKRLWDKESPDSYEFTVNYSTFILPYGCTPQSFRVVEGRISSLNSADCGARVDKLGSIPALFRLADRQLNAEPNKISFSFDPTFGYPIKFYAGSADIEDDYFMFEVVNFTPLD